MTIRLEQLADGSITDRNFQQLMSLVIDTGGESIGVRFGQKAFTWPGGTGLQTFTITHGLGRAPIVVLAINGNNNTRGMPRTYTYGATTFVLDIITSDASVPGAGTADTYYWLAVG